MADPATTGFYHQVLLYESPGELLTTAVPILREGLAAGDAIILTCRADFNALLADALGPDPHIACIQPGGIYRRAAVAAETYRELVAQRVAAGARRVRVVGEPDFGAGSDTLAECARYESICNAALAASPLTSVCAFDVGALPDQLIEDLVDVHPFVLTPTGRISNEWYVDPTTFLRRSAPAGADPVEQTSPAVEATTVTDLRQLTALRRQLEVGLASSTADGGVRADFLSAIHEVTVNALVHGVPPVRVRLWTTPGRLVCTVTDTGSGFDDPLAGYVRPAGTDPYAPGTGLWLARQRCDRVEMGRTAAGFTVRLMTASPVPHDAPG